MFHPKLLIALVIVAEISFLGFTSSFNNTVNLKDIGIAYHDIDNSFKFSSNSNSIVTYNVDDFDSVSNAIDLDPLVNDKGAYSTQLQQKIDIAMEEANLFTKNLDLEGIYLPHISEQLIQACIENQITQINLTNNYLETFPIELYQIPTLEALNLSHNQIELLPDEVSYFKNLSTLDLSHNKLQTVSESISDLEVITHLNLKNNDLTVLPTDAFHSLKRLQQLDISDNPIHKINYTNLKREIPNVNIVASLF